MNFELNISLLIIFIILKRKQQDVMVYWRNFFFSKQFRNVLKIHTFKFVVFSYLGLLMRNFTSLKYFLICCLILY